MSVRRKVTHWVIIFILNLFHAIPVWGTYQRMSIPGILFDDPKALPWVLKRIVPPLFVIQWLTFEVKAISRYFFGDDKFKANTSSSGKPTVAQILDRCQNQGFEQTVMTLGVCMSLTFVDLRPLDLRLPVAWAWAYIVGRPLYILGYLFDPKAGRGVGLHLGGFWMNMSALLYCFLVALGFSESITRAFWFYYGFLIVMTSLLTAILPSSFVEEVKAKYVQKDQ